MTYTPPSDPNQGVSNPAGSPQYSTYGTPQQGATYAAPGATYGNYAQPAPKSEKTTLGLWAMICGLSSIIIWPAGLGGVVVGIIALIKEQKKGMAITGIAAGVILPGIGFGILMVILSAIGYTTASSYYYY